MKVMKYLILGVLAASVLVGCDKQNAAIDEKNQAAKVAIDNEKKSVDVAAAEAKKQVADQAQLDADKQKADAQAALEKAKLAAEKK
jgi:hypothetical protein